MTATASERERWKSTEEDQLRAASCAASSVCSWHNHLGRHQGEVLCWDNLVGIDVLRSTSAGELGVS